MAQWYIENGIAEARAIRCDAGEIAEARVCWPHELGAGTITEAQLVSRRRGSSRGLARFADGTQALVERLPTDASEGAAIRLRITRPAMSEAGRAKLARARPSKEAPRPAPGLAEQLVQDGHEVREVRRFPEGDWNALMAEAFSREVSFPGGTLVLSPTPAMTLIDIDGEEELYRLGLAACPAVARVLRRFDIGGSIGIDFPTLAEKRERQALDAALASELAGWPHERTAMNGFGFVQLIARLERPSLLYRAAFTPTAAAARLLLRRAEMLAGAGTILLLANPALAPQLDAARLSEVSRRTGREVRLELDAGLAIEAPQAQFVGS